MTPTGICNAALAHIGQWSIADFDDTNPTAEACRRVFDATRRASLRAHHWNFALHRMALSESATAPQHGYAHAFTLPSDYLLAVQVNGVSPGTSTAAFSIEGGHVLTDDTAVNLWYVRDREAVSLWDDSFQEYFAARLAAAVAPSITSQPSIAANLMGIAEALLNKAKGTDAIESRPHVIRGPYYSGYAAARAGSTTTT